MNVNDLNSVSSKKVSEGKKDTRSNWMMFMFVSKCRYNVFRKQSSINACKNGFLELERFGFRFAKFGFAGTHLHLAVLSLLQALLGLGQLSFWNPWAG